MKSIFFIVLILFLSDCYAKSNSSELLTIDETNLKNFGFTYCLSKSDDKALNTEASLAMGGYFQSGNYTESAYSDIKSYVNNYLAGKDSIYQSTAKPSYLMNCLDLYNSMSYLKKLKKQKKFLIENQK